MRLCIKYPDELVVYDNIRCFIATNAKRGFGFRGVAFFNEDGDKVAISLGSDITYTVIGD